MFCFYCSSEIADGATFCKSCGNRLFEEKSNTNVMFVVLGVALVIVTVIGFGVLIGLSGMFLEYGLKGPGFGMPLFMLIMTIFGIDFMILRQMSYLMKAQTGSKQKIAPETYQAPKTVAQPAPLLQEYRQPVNSVVDGPTTRTLQEIPADSRKTSTF